MALSKETRIKIFIAIDIIFFLLEIVIGYTAHSLALVADAFHMLNDVISLFVGLWAVKAARERNSDSQYTYGWARAELLGGLVNGVFLVALCMSIVLDAIQRFFEPQEVKNPKLVLIVGGVGLAFNILGLFVFGGHAHSHGDEDGHDHDHAHAHDELDAAENGHSHKHDHSAHDHAHGAKAQHIHRPLTASKKRRQSRSYSTIDDLPIHPASVRQEILGYARGMDNDEDDEDTAGPSETSALLNGHRHAHTHSHSSTHHDHGSDEAGLDHSQHAHAQPRQAGSHGGHSHGDMNMRGMFLHVLGDALGNVGVMASALIIWLTPWSFRYYFDPAISLLITMIILKSALPLCKETAKPLLQAVPSHVSVEDIKADIETLPGIRSCHHVHVWALTPSKLVATLDVEVDFSIGTSVSASGREKWMALGKEIKSCLHGHGIHSSTIQPEFYDEISRKNSHAAGMDGLDDADCLMECNDACKTGKQCCGPASASKAGSKADSGSNSPK